MNNEQEYQYVEILSNAIRDIFELRGITFTIEELDALIECFFLTNSERCEAQLEIERLQTLIDETFQQKKLIIEFVYSEAHPKNAKIYITIQDNHQARIRICITNQKTITLEKEFKNCTDNSFQSIAAAHLFPGIILQLWHHDFKEDFLPMECRDFWTQCIKSFKTPKEYQKLSKHRWFNLLYDRYVLKIRELQQWQQRTEFLKKDLGNMHKWSHLMIN